MVNNAVSSNGKSLQDIIAELSDMAAMYDKHIKSLKEENRLLKKMYCNETCQPDFDFKVSLDMLRYKELLDGKTDG